MENLKMKIRTASLSVVFLALLSWAPKENVYETSYSCDELGMDNPFSSIITVEEISDKSISYSYSEDELNLFLASFDIGEEESYSFLATKEIELREHLGLATPDPGDIRAYVNISANGTNYVDSEIGAPTENVWAQRNAHDLGTSAHVVIASRIDEWSTFILGYSWVCMESCFPGIFNISCSGAQVRATGVVRYYPSGNHYIYRKARCDD